MYFKISFQNMKRSIKDYGIYFLTIVLGVALFYMFNSLDSQQAMLQIGESKKQMIELLIEMLGFISVFVSAVLALLIVYANKFLINRRKKEFGIYMLLGMGRRKISKIIILETIFIGIISLICGIAIGVLGSQFMSILVAKLFEADMTKFEFVFSRNACIKTCIYFAIMYLAVMVFNTITISKYKLINLLHADRKNEKITLKNPIISILVFLIGAGILGTAYYMVTETMGALKVLFIPIIMGIVGTILIFWSLSGFTLKIMQTMKNTYLNGTNMFVLRQLNNKINTTVMSMSVICLMLFMTITILSSSLSLREALQKDIIELTKADINMTKTANLPETYTTKNGKTINYKQTAIEDSKKSIRETLMENGMDMNLLKDIEEIEIYASKELTLKNFFGNKKEELLEQLPLVSLEIPEDIIKISDYNKMAKIYGIKEYDLKDDEYIVVCNFDNIKSIRDNVLAETKHEIKLAGKTYKSKYDKCVDGYVKMSNSHTNTGIILVPDNCNLKENEKEEYLFVANYNTKTEEGKQEIEEILSDKNGELLKNLKEKEINLDAISRIALIENSVGLATIITFVAIYLGIIFLIASAAILALKQLTESTDNKQRYTILRKIGCDEKMINKALFRQIAIFFLLPLALATIHSIFGIKFVMRCMTGLAPKETLITPIIATIVIFGVIYGAYFLATYIGSKNVIKEEN